MIRLNEAQPYQEYQITSSTSASAAQALALQDTNGPTRVVVEARGDTITFNFGGSSVAASKTVTSNALPAGNFSLAAGTIVTIDINQSQNYVSIIGAAGAGTAVIKLCSVSY